MDASGAPGGTQSLSQAQFGGVSLPAAHSGSVEPRELTPGGFPFSSQAGTFGSAKAAATWRKPAGVLPLSRATLGSTFTPFGAQ